MTIDKEKLDQNQAKNDLAQKELDEELKETLEDEGEYIEPKEDEEKPDPKPEETPPDPKPDEEEEETPPEKEDEKPTPPPEPEPKKARETKPVEEKRPAKYIPLDKYQDKKKAWQKDKEELEVAKTKIAELEELNKKEQSKAKEDEALEELADKWDTPIEFIRDLKDKLLEGQNVKPQTIVDEKKEAIENKEPEPITEEQIIENFNKEFDEFAPSLKSKYPKLTDDQLSQAKEELDKLAHTEEFSNYQLNHILAINKDKFKDILYTAPDNPGVEGGRPGRRASGSITSNSFKPDADGNYNFSSLMKMEAGEKRDEIVDGLPPEVWEAYVTELASEESFKVATNDGSVRNMR